jgi:hypothetical protein
MSADGLRRNLPVSHGGTCAFFVALEVATGRNSGDYSAIAVSLCLLWVFFQNVLDERMNVKIQTNYVSAACEEHADEFDGNVIPREIK